MKSFLTIIRSNFLQHTRSYNYFVSLLGCIALASLFVPPPNGGYTTLLIGEYIGVYNSAWFGYVTAMMTSIFVSLIGFFLVSNSIQKDVDTNIGQMISASPVSNQQYILAKLFSNFFVLLSILLGVFMTSIVLFFLYSKNQIFDLRQFLYPYAILALPSLFVTACLAIVFEVVFGNRNNIKNAVYFILFIALLTMPASSNYLDVFGTKTMLQYFEQLVSTVSNSEVKNAASIGFVSNDVANTKTFLFEGMQFAWAFIFSRGVLALLALLGVFASSFLFRRFATSNWRLKPATSNATIEIDLPKPIELGKLPQLKNSSNAFPLLFAETKMLWRRTSKWLLFLNLLGVFVLSLAPIEICQQFVLPILFFINVSIWSSIDINDKMNNMELFTLAAHQPLVRVFSSQLLAGISWAIILAAPLLLRFIFTSNFIAVTAIVLGSIFINVFAALLGNLSNGKKLFEAIFFFVTYACINGVLITDYFGGQHQSWLYVFVLFAIVLSGLLALVSWKRMAVEVR